MRADTTLGKRFAREPGAGRSGMIVIPALMSNNREMLAALAVHHRLAAIYPPAAS